MSRAVFADTFGPLASLSLRDHPRKALAPDEVCVAIKAAGIAYADALIVKGHYQVKPPLPFIPGTECAGVAVALGDAVDDLSVGDAVVGQGWYGLLAEIAHLPRHAVRPMPAEMPFEQAAVLPVSYATAWHALVDRGTLRAGETLLVLGAGGATGFAAVQIGRHLGARVIASASTAEKRDLAVTGGASMAVDSRDPAWRDQVVAANNGKPVDVVFDPVGGEATERAFRCLAWNGRHLVIGFTAGMTSLRTNLPLLKGASLVGVDIRQFGLREPAAAAANLDRIFALAQAGELCPAVARRYPLDDVVAAFEYVAKGDGAGRTVVMT